MAFRFLFFSALALATPVGPKALATQAIDVSESGTARIEAEGLTEGAIRIGSRPSNRSAKARYSANLSNRLFFLTAGGEDYEEAEIVDSHFLTLGVGFHQLGTRSFQRVSIGRFQISCPWHLLYDLPNDYRLEYVESNLAAIYEFISLDGLQTMIAAYRGNEIENRHQKRLGAIAKVAWQWPGQEASRVGASYKISPEGKYEGLSGTFQNKGFKGQTISAEIIRQRKLADIFILSQTVSSLAGFDSKVILSFARDRTWQLSFERWSPVWKGLGWNLKLEARKRNPGGIGGAIIGGLGGKI